MTYKFHGELITRGTITGYKRGLRRQRGNSVLIKMEKIGNKNKQLGLIGKKVIYFCQSKKDRKTKLNWGKIRALHGRNGAYIAKFKKTITPSAFSEQVFILPFPNKN